MNCPNTEIINLTDDIFIFYWWRKREGSGGWSTLGLVVVMPPNPHI